MTTTAQHRMYVCGPMTGLPEHNFPLFDAVASWLRARYDGATVVNPAELSRAIWSENGDRDAFHARMSEPEARATYYAVDLANFRDCDVFVLLPEWWRSRGATWEVLNAVQLGRRLWAIAPEGAHDYAVVEIEITIPQAAWLHLLAEMGEPATHWSTGTPDRERAVRTIMVGTASRVVIGDRHESVLAEADRLIVGARQGDYGHALDNFTTIAELWTGYLRGKQYCFDRDRLAAEDVAMLLVLLKLGREMGHHKRDNIVDAAGYVGCLDQVVTERARRAGAST